MVDSLNPKEWMNRAKSNLVLAKSVNKENLKQFGGEVYYEELCYEYNNP